MTVPKNINDIAPCIAKGRKSLAFPDVYTFSQNYHFLYKIDSFRDIISSFSEAEIFLLLLSINEESVDLIDFSLQILFFGDELGGRVVVLSFYSISIHFSRFFVILFLLLLSSMAESSGWRHLQLDGGIVPLKASAATQFLDTGCRSDRHSRHFVLVFRRQLLKLALFQIHLAVAQLRIFGEIVA